MPSNNQQASTPIDINFSDAIDYANFHYYSKPLTVINIGGFVIPITPPAKMKRLRQDNNEYIARLSHGLLHTTAAMDLIGDIYGQYVSHVPDFQACFEETARTFKISSNELFNLIQVAALFHDSAREGDGVDLWDPQSAEACFKYLKSQPGVDEYLARFIADTILYKDDNKVADKDGFKTFADKWGKRKDYVRQLVNMADTLEVIRCRDTFKPEYMPISKYVNEETMRNHIIPDLVVPHRTRIMEEGRLGLKAKIVYPGYTDDQFTGKYGIDEKKAAQRYHQLAQAYDFSLNKNSVKNLDNVINKAIRGVQDYIDNHTQSGIQFHHNGFFNPRFHGNTGRKRAEALMKDLTTDRADDLEKLVKLKNFLKANQGPTLTDSILRSLNQTNKQTCINLFETYIKEELGKTAPIVVNL